jgi:hypothetical protein
MDLKIGVALWFAGVTVAVWAYFSNRRRARKASRIVDRVNYRPSLPRGMDNDQGAMTWQAPLITAAPIDYFELGRKLAAQGSETCLDCQEGIHGLPEDGCACACHGSRVPKGGGVVTKEIS